MSNRLSLSAALSVLMMAGYALFSPQAAHVPIGGGSLPSPVQVAADGLPQASNLLPSLR